MIRKIINDLIPPLFKRYYKKLKQPSYKPEWVSLKGGLEGIELFMDPETLLSKELINGHDTFFYDIIDGIKQSKPDLTIYDIGAHMGYHTLGFAKYSGKKGRVYAFEPHPMNLARLKKNIDRNPDLAAKIIIKDIGISDREGEVTFRMYKNLEEGVSSASGIVAKDKITGKDNSLYKEIRINTVKTDTLIEISEISPPDLMKIDIEGAEYLALKGAEETIRKFRPVLLIEIHTIANMYLVLGFLNNLGYKSAIVSEEKDGRCFLHCKAE